MHAELQKRYTNYIKSDPEWEFVGVYTYEGFSGLNTRHRDGFNEMIADALAGRIDLIVTKSVSRFARNTVAFVTLRSRRLKPSMAFIAVFNGLSVVPALVSEHIQSSVHLLNFRFHTFPLLLNANLVFALSETNLKNFRLFLILAVRHLLPSV